MFSRRLQKNRTQNNTLESQLNAAWLELDLCNSTIKELKEQLEIQNKDNQLLMQRSAVKNNKVQKDIESFKHEIQQLNACNVKLEEQLEKQKKRVPSASAELFQREV